MAPYHHNRILISTPPGCLWIPRDELGRASSLTSRQVNRLNNHKAGMGLKIKGKQWNQLKQVKLTRNPHRELSGKWKRAKPIVKQTFSKSAESAFIPFGRLLAQAFEPALRLQAHDYPMALWAISARNFLVETFWWEALNRRPYRRFHGDLSCNPPNDHKWNPFSQVVGKVHEIHLYVSRVPKILFLKSFSYKTWS